MIPGMGAAVKDIDISNDSFKPIESIIKSMTQKERELPDIIDGNRRKRIPGGAGRTIKEVNNLLNQEYRTGGFEQGRNANFRQLRDHKALDTPVFGNKYWYGRGTTYFLNVNLRF